MAEIRTGIAPGKPPATMSPEGSGFSVLSNEELARRETFYKFDRSGRPTFLGRQPDATLRPGEVIVAIGPQGQARVVNSLNAGSDAEVLKRLAPRLAKLPRLPVGGMGGTTLRAVGPIGFFLGLPGQVHLLNQFQRDPFFLRGLDVPLS